MSVEEIPETEVLALLKELSEEWNLWYEVKSTYDALVAAGYSPAQAANQALLEWDI